MLRNLPRVLDVLAIVSFLGVGGLYYYWFLARDSCMDAGGVFDYVSHVCRKDVQTLPAGWLVSPTLTWSMLLIAAVSLAAAFGIRAHHRRAA